MNEKQILSVYELKNRYDPDPPHSEQVTRLALKLFDLLRDLHKLDDRERNLLHAAALLHDIGYAIGDGKQHHINSTKLILQNKLSGFSENEIKKIAYTACLHRRRSTPEECLAFNGLEEEDKNIVLKLASLLRLADGMDRTHRSSVKDVECRINEEVVIFYLKSDFSLDQELQATIRKSTLFKEIFSRDAIFLQK